MNNSAIALQSHLKESGLTSSARSRSSSIWMRCSAAIAHPTRTERETLSHYLPLR
ncbi:MAG: hypothetical protein M3O33_09485 [Cyanobacteriota bacterium]|nr:hypothetical protein [Cyanobacteriota bacterium]